MSNDETEAEKRRAIEELDRQIAIRNASLKTGVPPGFLQNGRTAEEIDRIASDALAWRQAPSPAPPRTAAVSPPTYAAGQISRSMLPHLGPEGVMEAYRQGRLDQEIGVSPEQRQNGHHR